jgi:hypothetical protein
LPLSTWLKALWLIPQSDKGLSSIRLAEALGVSKPTAWRIGHALRLMLARENPRGTVEIDEFFLGGRPKKRTDEPASGRRRKGLRRTTRRPVLAVVQRPSATSRGAPAGDARAAVVANLSMDEVERLLEKEVEPTAHLMSDEWKAFVAVGQNFAAHQTVQHAFGRSHGASRKITILRLKKDRSAHRSIPLYIASRNSSSCGLLCCL